MKWKKVQYPTKRTMNLVINETNHSHKIKVATGICLIAIAGGIFVKFGILNRLEMIQEEKAYYQSLSVQIDALQNTTKQYSDVQSEYYLYTDALLTKSEQAEKDRMEILEMIEQCAFKKAEITNITVQDNQITLTVRSKSLSKLSEVVSNFQNYEKTAYVSVSTAASNNQEIQGDVLSNIVIELK